MAEETTPAVEAPTEGGALAEPATTPATDSPSLLAQEAPKAEESAKPAGEAPAPEPVKFDSLKLPEGLSLDETQQGEFLAAAEGMSSEQAQRMLDYGSKALRAAAEEPLKAWKAENDKWVEQVKSDPEIGGTNWDATRTAIAKMLDVHGTPGIKQALNYTGAGNNPEIIRTFANIAKHLNEGAHISGAPTAGAQKDLASIMYPDLPNGAPN